MNIRDPAVGDIPRSVAGRLKPLALACEPWLANHPEDISEQVREIIQDEPELWAGRCALIMKDQPGHPNLDDFWRMIARPDATQRVATLTCRELGEPKKKGARRK